ncbi:apolipoprotein N-acyltransferase [Methylocella tundrae]|uniref:Apolipoprotein N-acyltransferase n=1 Tax=Methylocella tundrae TaxID=227605 RepID=A0A4U8Z250_METTU|nr:apolipoprotein N-acyltransferase [Methylocella tundrae]WPP03337.1 apolipoprotein N-acyltransferase [Methylocella tundrae]VFU09376.1 Apolipoprotein N-acyltransferase [Methylocella tundrae]
MFALAASITKAAGWRRRLIALSCGAVGALAMAPFNFFAAMAVPMTVAVWLIDGSTALPEKKPVIPLATSSGREWRVWRKLPLAARRAFWAGWWWGFGYFLAGLWWLGAAFLADNDQYVFAMPLGVIGLPAAMAIYPALGFMLARLIWTQGPSRIFAFAAALTFTEWLRGRLFTGFPWNGFGMALGGNLAGAQLASVIGLYGLTIVTIVLFSAPATLAAQPFSRRPLAPTGAALVALAAIFGFGAWRLAQAPQNSVAGVALRIMQPNLAEDDKFRPQYRDEILDHYLKLSALAADADSLDVTVVIWPESAFPFILSRDPEAMAEIGAALPLGSILVTGAARAQEDPRTIAAGLGLPISKLANPVFFNTIQVIGSGGVLIDSYDKAHLVPFGEYLPFESLLTHIGLHHFVHIPGGFEPGPGRKTLNVPGLPPVAPLICYEAIFPGEVLPQEPGAPRPGLLLNVTNDGWFGLTAGPYQHFAQARLRAIEEGLPLIRAANTGVSAIVDPYGRVKEQLPLGVEGLLKGSLPAAIPAPVFARHPFLTPFLCWIAVLAIAVAVFSRKRV